MRAAQNHVVDQNLPAHRPVPQRHDRFQAMALAARHRHKIPAVARRQAVTGACRRSLPIKRAIGHSQNEKPEDDNHSNVCDAAHAYTFLLRRSATEYAGYHSDSAPMPSRCT